MELRRVTDFIQAGVVTGLEIHADDVEEDWVIALVGGGDHAEIANGQYLEAKRGGVRRFATLDSAISVCHSLGMTTVVVRTVIQGARQGRS